jgi:hypothetical protein
MTAVLKFVGVPRRRRLLGMTIREEQRSFQNVFFESSKIVTGPSLIRDTFIIA